MYFWVLKVFDVLCIFVFKKFLTFYVLFNLKDQDDTLHQAVNSLIQDDLDDDSEVTLHHVTPRGGNSMHSRHIRSVNARKMKETEEYKVTFVNIDSAIRNVLKVTILHPHFCSDCDFNQLYSYRNYVCTGNMLFYYDPLKQPTMRSLYFCARI